MKTPPAEDEWADLSLEELAATRVSLVSRKEESVWQAPAAVFVITHEDLRRSGVTSIPEALRLAPGLQVSRLDANKWAISARGFGFRFADKLLVLIDGRSVYTPLFSGVYWDSQDVHLEDVEQIEVVHGPGATLWGANAVNGIINIVTKNASRTQGLVVHTGSGTQERGFANVRYGSKLGTHGYYRVYGKYFDRQGFEDSTGTRNADDWRGVRAGFRADIDRSDSDQLTIQGDFLDNDINQTITLFSPSVPFNVTTPGGVSMSAANLLGRWKRTFSAASDLELQVYYDRYDRSEAIVSEVRNTIDLDFQHRFTLRDRHELVWGGGYRLTRDDLAGSFTLSYDPAERDAHLFSGFAQDDITLFRDRVRVIAGAKLEHHEFTGFELQPNARALWHLHQHHVLWAAASRAKRTPSRSDNDGRLLVFRFPGVDDDEPQVFGAATGNRAMDSEILDAVELGYRWRLMDGLNLDAAGFYHSYDRLRGAFLGGSIQETDPQPYAVTQFVYDNSLEGDTKGIEFTGSWRVRPTWSVQGGYTFTDVDAEGLGPLSSSTPSHQAFARVSLDPRRHWYLDGYARYVSALQDPDVEEFVDVDLRVAWEFAAGMELAVVGQNLLDDGHTEFMPTLLRVPQGHVPRAVYASLSWHR